MGRHHRYTRRRQAVDMAVTLAVYGHGILATTARAAARRWRRRPSQRARVLVLVLGAVIALALAIGYFDPGVEDIAFGSFMTASAISVGLGAGLLGELRRRR